MFLNLCFFVIFITFIYFIDYGFNYLTYPKYYVINKFKKFIKNDFHIKLNLLMNNTDLKYDIMKTMDDVLFQILYIEFDLNIDDANKFYNNNNLYNTMNISLSLLNYKNLSTNIIKKNFKDYYINNSLTNNNKFRKLFNKYFIDDIYNSCKIFLTIFNNYLNLHKYESIKDKRYIDDIFKKTLYDKNFRESYYYNNNNLLNLTYQNFSSLNKNYKCFQVINTICPTNFTIIKNSKYYLYKEFSFSGIKINVSKCCDFDDF